MSQITIIIALFCSEPSIYKKFYTTDATKGLMVLRCENSMYDCLGITGSLRYCAKDLRAL